MQKIGSKISSSLRPPYQKITRHKSQHNQKFPDIVEFTAGAYHEVDADEMLTAIQRTIFAVEKDEVRIALSGADMESFGDV